MMYYLTMPGGRSPAKQGKFIPNEQLRYYREKLGLSQTKLAKLVGCSQPDIQGLERGSRRTTAEWAEKIAPHLGITPRDLFPRAPGSPRIADRGGLDYAISNRAMEVARRFSPNDNDPLQADIFTLMYNLLAHQRDGHMITDDEATLELIDTFVQRVRSGFPSPSRDEGS